MWAFSSLGAGAAAGCGFCVLLGAAGCRCWGCWVLLGSLGAGACRVPLRDVWRCALFAATKVFLLYGVCAGVIFDVGCSSVAGLCVQALSSSCPPLGRAPELCG